VAEAYENGEAVSLALYGSDTAQHSSKYFHSSEVGTAVPSDPMTPGRPTLVVTWGSARGTITKRVSNVVPQMGEPVTYALTIVGSGEPLSLLDVLPAGLSTPTNLSAGLVYDSGQLTWSGTPALDEVVTLNYTVTVTAEEGVIANEVVLSQEGEPVSSDTAVLIINGVQMFLPVVFR
ncbi:MAG: DUF11 domain-containing protein, partial [Anaerolineales bacterium]|nr:DUF11 domain-containing protein [Anaerolineales bacterium]